MKLVDERTPDGSRHFACLPQTTDWTSVCDHALALPSARLLNFVSNAHGGAWFDFCYRQHRFLIRVHENRLRLFVHDPLCPDLILYQVGRHFEQLLDRGDGRGQTSDSRVPESTDSVGGSNTVP